MKKTVIAENPNWHAPRVKVFISLKRDDAAEEVGVGAVSLLAEASDEREVVALPTRWWSESHC